MEKEYQKEWSKRIVGEKMCECGCGKNIVLKKHHFLPSRSIPKYLRGHAPTIKIFSGEFCGPKHPRWNGGEIKMNGYVYCYSPNHPFKNKIGSGYVGRSRLKMEEKLNRYLGKMEIVHHVNAIRDDDRIENLVILTHSEHSSLHSTINNKTLQRREDGRLIKKEGEC